MNEFDEAKQATEDMFTQQQGIEAPEGGEQTAPVEDTSAQEGGNAPVEGGEEQTMQQAVDAASVAAEAAAQKDRELQEALARIQQLEGTVAEMSKAQEEKIIEEMLTPPTLDIDALSFADEETRQKAMAEYAEKMSAYNRQQMMGEIKPFIDYSKAMKDASDRDEAIRMLADIPQMKGIADMRPQLDRIIASTPLLNNSDVPIEEKYVVAYAMANGVNAINAPAPTDPSVDDMMKMYNNSPAFREQVEMQRIAELKKGQQVPPFSASSGAATAALNIKEKPKSWDDAFERTYETFGGRRN